ncbi:plasmid replication initiator TrfA [Burkholderia stagnalis]|uniref:plasmid replication initiator TrfA n=1 Tax=Burkholderia stagnalis TaxID=1503054 RepID=UPI000F5C9305|nr:plasmid replication initiator TrfA [Burkholderia stagnalis]RQY17978.1 RepB family plasmid replication initiator protein [Burkholderia stagnalis]RQY91725.1 RepB family plasmid replication initiator protein [Burkholderia stagnalis]RQY99542.1 RepB family plasmid replication initiator protein [Burkholderia stagnalis]
MNLPNEQTLPLGVEGVEHDGGRGSPVSVSTTKELGGRATSMSKLSSSRKKPVADVLRRMPHLLEYAARAEKQNRPARQAAGDVGCRSGQQLPPFPDVDVSVLPNCLARTPLFAPIRAGRRTMHDHVLLASPEGVDVRFTGKQLDMADQDVFMLALKWARGVDVNAPIRCNRAEFLRALGWKPSKMTGAFGNSAYKWIDESFDRLTSAKLTIETTRYKARLVLVSSWVEDTNAGEWELTLDGKILALFQTNEFSFIDLAKRRRITTRVDLAKWLQSYAASHKRGWHRISVDKLREWCGYSSPIRKFREALRDALQELERVEIVSHVSFYKDEKMVKWWR